MSVSSPSLKNKVFYPAVVLKNAEMLFNFGDSALKFPPLEGFVAFKDAPAPNSVENTLGAAGAVTERKKVNNAPQAIIIGSLAFSPLVFLMVRSLHPCPSNSQY